MPLPEGQSAEQDDAQALADFQAGFSSISESDPDPETEANAGQPAGEAQTDPLTQADLEAIINDPDMPTLTKAQLDELIAKASRVDQLEDRFRKAEGRIGELNQTVQKLTEKPAEPAAPDPEITQFEQDYADIAKATRKLAKQEAEAIIKAAPKSDPALDQKSLQALLEEREKKIRADVNVELISMLHEDWGDIVTDQAYKTWLATQPEDVQTTALTTESGVELGRVITQYKAFKGQAQAKTAQNKQRLERAVSADGVPGAPAHKPTETDEFLAGFNSVAKARA